MVILEQTKDYHIGYVNALDGVDVAFVVYEIVGLVPHKRFGGVGVLRVFDLQQVHRLNKSDLIRVEVLICQFLVVVLEIHVENACENT